MVPAYGTPETVRDRGTVETDYCEAEKATVISSKNFKNFSSICYSNIHILCSIIAILQ